MEDVPIAYVLGRILEPRDDLRDGTEGEKIEINQSTILVWVDYHPETKFGHKTGYVLIGETLTQVWEGEWWPVINGRPLSDLASDYVLCALPIS